MEEKKTGKTNWRNRSRPISSYFISKFIATEGFQNFCPNFNFPLISPNLSRLPLSSLASLFSHPSITTTCHSRLPQSAVAAPTPPPLLSSSNHHHGSSPSLGYPSPTQPPHHFPLSSSSRAQPPPPMTTLTLFLPLFHSSCLRGGDTMDERWRKQQILELEVYSKRLELVQDQIKSAFLLFVVCPKRETPSLRNIFSHSSSSSTTTPTSCSSSPCGSPLKQGSNDTDFFKNGGRLGTETGSKRRLIRQRKLRHVTQDELSLCPTIDQYRSLPVSRGSGSRSPTHLSH